MSYPTQTPTSRSYTPGNWGQKTYNAISGAEIRIRYGNKRFNDRLNLSYQNVTDTEADLFLAHYNSMLGTYKTFSLPSGVTTGWRGSNYPASQSGMKYRYESAPSITSQRPGVSSVSVSLIGVV